MKVLLVTTAYYPNFGGGALRFRSYAPGLAELGVTMEVFVGTVEEGGTPGELLPPVDVEGVRVHRVVLPQGRPWGARRAFHGGLLRHCRSQRPDVVQFVFTSLDLCPVLAALRVVGVPTVAACTLISERSTQPLKRAMQPLYWWVPYHLATEVVVNGTATADELRAVSVRRRIHVIPYGVNLERFRPPADDAERRACRRTLGLPEDARIVVTIGSVIPRKGHDLMLEAWAAVAHRHPETHLVVVGRH